MTFVLINRTKIEIYLTEVSPAPTLRHHIADNSQPPIAENIYNRVIKNGWGLMTATYSSSIAPITVVIADGNAMAGRLLTDQLKHCREFSIVSCSSDQDSLIRAVNETRPGVAVISTDLRDGVLSGLAALREVQEANPEVRSILLSDHPDPNIVVEGLRAGARGFFARCNFDFAALCKCIQRVFEGQIWIGNIELEYVFDALARTRPLRVVNLQGLNLLSRREEEVMRLVAEGMGNRDIAHLLKLSEHTVKNYLFRVFEKLGISNRVELVLYAVSNTKASGQSLSDPGKLPNDRASNT
jgi:two-component system, NarL family, response regulator DegU